MFPDSSTAKQWRKTLQVMNTTKGWIFAIGVSLSEVSTSSQSIGEDEIAC